MIYRRIVERQLRCAFEALNRGDHALRLKWGKLVSLRVCCDTQVLASVLDERRSQGVADAGLLPIVDAVLAAP